MTLNSTISTPTSSTARTNMKNLRALHKACHKRKTALDIKANAKIKRLRGETKGRPKRDWPKGPKMKSRPFQKRKKP